MSSPVVARSIPVHPFVRNGELVDNVVGAQPPRVLCRHIEGLLAAA